MDAVKLVPPICRMSAYQDDCPIHNYGHTQQWFQRNNIKLLRVPLYSPDLDIIENVWGFTKSRIRKDPNPPNNADDLYQRLRTIWLE